MARIKDLRPMLGPARSQGRRGTCLAFAVTAGHENHDPRVTPTFAIEVLYWGAKQHDGHPGPGTTFPAAAAALQKWGQPDESLWPYDPSRDESAATYSPPPQTIDPAVCVFAGLRSIMSTTVAVQAELDQDRVVAIGAPTWPGLRRPAGDRIDNPTVADLDGGFHAMAVVGYQADTREFLLRNSWGTRWGDQGHAWVPMSFIDDHARAAWVVDEATATAPSAPSGGLATDGIFGEDS